MQKYEVIFLDIHEACSSCYQNVLGLVLVSCELLMDEACNHQLKKAVKGKVSTIYSLAIPTNLQLKLLLTFWEGAGKIVITRVLLNLSESICRMSGTIVG